MIHKFLCNKNFGGFIMTKKKMDATPPAAAGAPSEKGPGAARFDKKRLLESRRWSERRDLLGALLEDGREYSHGEVEELIEKFLRLPVPEGTLD
jgi:hypothetical protein